MIKNGNYQKALEIISQLSLDKPEKNHLLCRPNPIFEETVNNSKGTKQK